MFPLMAHQVFEIGNALNTIHRAMSNPNLCEWGGAKMQLLLIFCSLLAIKNLLNNFILEFRISLLGQISAV